jgi:transcriptional regulator with GAF, ATPase, and Fis domain
MERESVSIAVCGTDPEALDELAATVSNAGQWGVVPIHWPNPIAWDAAHHTRVFVIDSDHACSDLAIQLRGRDGIAVIAIGETPLDELVPNVWLRATPAVTLLAPVLEHFLDSHRAETLDNTAPIWRRKSDMIVGNSPQLRQLLHTLDQLAPSTTPVLISGESGVGKELVARSLHFCGPRAAEPFVAINCAAIPETLFESELFGYQRGAFTGAVNAKPGAVEAAHQGTLFLDEIGELPLALQAKLLRVLETGEVQRIGATEPRIVKVRLVSATNRELDKEVEHGRFREDLYYRIVVYPVHIAPLRERPEDIPPIVAHQLSTIGRRENRPALRLTAAALEKLIGYPWPGNVRELVNLLERAVLLAPGSIVDAEHVSFAGAVSATVAEPVAMPVAYRDAKARFELDYYSQLMRTAAGNVSLAAKLGQKTRKEIYDALRRLELDPERYREQQ